jgi:hypothetical protein
MRLALAALLLPLLPAAAQAGAGTVGDDPRNIIAAQIRDQGYQCDSPQSATQDMQASRPDEAVWIIVCESASYRVRLDPDMAAKVEKIGQDKNESGEGSGENGETK